MGQIQQAISGAVTSVVGANIAKELKLEKTAKETMEAASAAPKLLEEAETLETKAFDIEEQISGHQKELNKLNPSSPMDRIKGAVVSMDIEKANDALANVQREIYANKLQRERVGKILNTTLETRSEAFDKYDKMMKEKEGNKK